MNSKQRRKFFNDKWRRIKSSKRVKSGIPFNITPRYLQQVWTGICPVTGKQLFIDGRPLQSDSPELDRYSPQLGYVKGNVYWLSRQANQAKSNSDVDLLEKLVVWMKMVNGVEHDNRV